MPRELVCPHCEHRLTVSSRLAQRAVTCPRCRRAVPVPPAPVPTSVASPPASAVPSEGPTDAAIAELAADAGRAEKPGTTPPPAVPQPPPRPPRPQPPAAPPRYVPLEDTPRGLQAGDLTRDLRADVSGTVAVPRRVIVMQGILLGAMGLGGFAAGVFASRGRWTNSAAARQPCVIVGTVQYAAVNATGESLQPDADSVALLFPRDLRPDRGQKLKVAGLRPQDPPLTEGDPVFEALHTLGGDYARASQQGFYYLKARDAGDYFLLVLSAHARRSPTTPIERQHLAEIGRYVDRAAELLGPLRYEWRELSLRGDERIDVVL